MAHILSGLSTVVKLLINHYISVFHFALFFLCLRDLAVPFDLIVTLHVLSSFISYLVAGVNHYLLPWPVGTGGKILCHLILILSFGLDRFQPYVVWSSRDFVATLHSTDERISWLDCSGSFSGKRCYVL